MQAKRKALPTLWQGLRETVAAYYENFFLSMSGSFLWAVFHIPLVSIITYFGGKLIRKEYIGEVGLYLFIILPVLALLTGPANAGIFCMIKKMLDGEGNITLIDFFRGAKRFFIRSWQIAASFYLILGILVYNLFIIFYMFPSFVKLVFSLVTLLFLFYFGLSFNYAFSFMVEQSPTYKKIWPKVISLFVDNAAVTFVLAITVAAFTILTILFPLTFLFIYISLVGGLQYSVFKQLLARYD